VSPPAIWPLIVLGAYRLAALSVLWCGSDVTSEPVMCCPAHRLVENGGATEVALITIACYDHSTQWAWDSCDILGM
jgi:hypothetical protein